MKKFDLKKKEDIKEIIDLLESGATIMVKPYDDDYENFTGVTDLDFTEDSESEIIKYFLEKEEVEYWDDDNY